MLQFHIEIHESRDLVSHEGSNAWCPQTASKIITVFLIYYVACPCTDKGNVSFFLSFYLFLFETGLFVLVVGLATANRFSFTGEVLSEKFG